MIESVKKKEQGKDQRKGKEKQLNKHAITASYLLTPYANWVRFDKIESR